MERNFEVKIKALPQKGKANKEIIKEFSKITKTPVEIISGHKSHHKTLKIYIEIYQKTKSFRDFKKPYIKIII